jgi:glycerophosphoryl diester phosphodiesterase
MKILAHRGYWIDANEKNSITAFERSFSAGFGVETDIRDSGMQLYIAHDMASGKELSFNHFLDLYNKFENSSTLALNIKADGLQLQVKKHLDEKKISDYFFFDMSIPDALGYAKNNLRFFTRQSEYELQPCLYDKAAGVWLDEFNGHWITEEIIMQHHQNGKKICIVSPELHKRPYESEWEHYRYIINKSGLEDIMICTDFPMDAKKYFNV